MSPTSTAKRVQTHQVWSFWTNFALDVTLRLKFRCCASNKNLCQQCWLNTTFGEFFKLLRFVPIIEFCCWAPNMHTCSDISMMLMTLLFNNNLSGLNLTCLYTLRNLPKNRYVINICADWNLALQLLHSSFSIQISDIERCIVNVLTCCING